jgi:hypothetical protein
MLGKLIEVARTGRVSRQRKEGLSLRGRSTRNLDAYWIVRALCAGRTRDTV